MITDKKPGTDRIVNWEEAGFIEMLKWLKNFHGLFAEKNSFSYLIFIFYVLKPRSFSSNLGFEE